MEVCLTLPLLGGHRKQIIFLTVTVIALWSVPLLHSLKIACLCKTQWVPLLPGVCLIPCQEALFSWSFKKLHRTFYSTCIYGKLCHFGSFIGHNYSKVPTVSMCFSVSASSSFWWSTIQEDTWSDIYMFDLLLVLLKRLWLKCKEEVWPFTVFLWVEDGKVYHPPTTGVAGTEAWRHRSTRKNLGGFLNRNTDFVNNPDGTL